MFEEHVQELKEYIARQNITGTQGVLSIYREKHTQQLEALAHGLHETREQLNTLYALASQQAQWPGATLQLRVSLEQIDNLVIPDTLTEPILQRISQNLELKAEEHNIWLQKLHRLHQQKNSLEQEIAMALAIEMEKKANVALSLQAFKNARSHFSQTMKHIHQNLAQILNASKILNTHELSLTDIPIQDGLAATWEKKPERFAGALEKEGLLTTEPTRHMLEELTNMLLDSMVQIQQNIDDLQIEINIKDVYYTELEQRYEQKREEQTNLPPCPSQYIVARNTLSTAGIEAFPLYTLLDFAPEIEPSEAIHIECMLETHGLLDALVLLEKDITRADDLLRAENGNYRLSIEKENTLLPEPSERYPQGKLRFDRASSDFLGQDAGAWERRVTQIIQFLETQFLTEDAGCYPMARNREYGLVEGRSTSENARIIGRSTRQRDLETMHTRLLKMNSQCHELYQSFFQVQECRDDLQRALSRLQKMQIMSAIDEVYSHAQAHYFLLEQAKKHLQEARVYTAQKRMQHTCLLDELEEVSFSHPLFAQHHGMIITALQAVERLVLSLAFLRRDLQRLIWLCQDIEKTLKIIEQAEKTRDINLSLLQQFLTQILLEEKTRSLSPQPSLNDSGRFIN